jgi:hypothetical protein
MRPLNAFGLAALLLISSAAVAQQNGAAQPSAAPSAPAPSATPAPANSPASDTGTNPAKSAPGTTSAAPSGTAPSSPNDTASATSASGPAANKDGANDGTNQGKKGSSDSKSGDKSAPQDPASAKTDALPSPGEDLDPHIKKGSEDDVNAVGNRCIGCRGVGNWYSTNWEISTGKQYATEIEKSAHLVTDPVIEEYVNRVGQNIVKNSDCKVPFTIKVIDSDEINAMALPGGFFYVNSGLIMAADEEAELAGVMAHETAHVCAHHAAREQTKMNYMQIGSIPLMIVAYGSWTGYGIYEASQLAIPVTFLQFSRASESEADWLGLEYMYKAGYDPQAFIQFFEKIQALEKHKPGAIAKVFSDHPQTPDRIMHSEEEIATIMPPKPDYVVTTSEFDDIKARLARIENKRKINDKSGGNKPTLRRVGTSNNDPNAPGTSTSDDRPTLGHHD